jgi:hypothetical protein
MSDRFYRLAPLNLLADFFNYCLSDEVGFVHVAFFGYYFSHLVGYDFG